MLHRPATATQSKALLAAILIFANKSCDQPGDDDVQTGFEDSFSSSYFATRALKYVNLAMFESEDEPLSLSLLQALILVTHWLLIQGVRAKAWRYLGIAIRSAYELNMHLIDAGRGAEDIVNMDASQWCEDEERRRAWWAIWEMDVSNSHQNRTRLPKGRKRRTRTRLD